MRYKRKVLDMDYVMRQIKAGKTQVEIAKELGVSQGHVQISIMRYKVEQEKTRNLDTGKVGALHKAGWNTKSIAEEINVPEEVIENVLKEEK